MFTNSPAQHGFTLSGGRQTLVDFVNWCRPIKRSQIASKVLCQRFRDKDEIVSIEPLATIREVFALTTDTGNYVCWGYASKNSAYDVMEAAGVTRNEARCSPPYGEQPIRRLWSYKTCWPELWAKMTQRVHGAATAARYANTELYGIGVVADDLPEGKTWSSWTMETLAKLSGETKVDVAKAIQAALREHRNVNARVGRVAPELPDDEPDPVSGYCWKILYPIAAAGGDKFGRQSQKARVRATSVRKKNGVPLA